MTEAKKGRFEDDDCWDDVQADDPMAALESMSDNDILMATKQFEAERKQLENRMKTTTKEIKDMERRITEFNKRKDDHTKLPYLVANVGELLDLPEEEEENSGSGMRDAKKDPIKVGGVEIKMTKNKAITIKTTHRHSIFMPNTGLIDHETLKPGELIAVNKDTYTPYEKLPPEYDSRVRSMEVDEKPTDDYNEMGGVDKQIEEMQEAIVLPMTEKEKFKKLGIRPPKGLLMHGPPGTGKTLMARACAAKGEATFLKLAATQLSQMYIGEGARIVRDAFALARAKAPCIIFIDELDAVGAKRGSGENETREIHRTMMELLNQLDGFD